MKVIKSALLATSISCSLVLTGCAHQSNFAAKPSGFLSHYNQLKPVANPPPQTHIYTYNNPTAQPKNYHAVIVAPVRVYQTATTDGVTEKSLQTARQKIQQGIIRVVRRKMPITTKAGPGVAKLQVAITGAELEQQGFKPRNLIPVSAALKLASMATGLNQKKPAMIVAIKITDSVNGKVLREVLTTINGPAFRDKAHTATAFSQLAQKWVQQALNYSKTR